MILADYDIIQIVDVFFIFRMIVRVMFGYSYLQRDGEFRRILPKRKMKRRGIRVALLKSFQIAVQRKSWKEFL